MSKNDIVLLDAIIEERQKIKFPSDDIGECFEFFVIEQLLKDYELPQDKLRSGWIDGNGDGGIDGAYVFINGNLYSGEKEFFWPRCSTEICIEIISCKHHCTFEKSTIDTMFPSLQELFDLRLPETKGYYSDLFHIFRKNVINVCRQLARYNPRMKIHISYASRGDSANISNDVKSRKNHLIDNLAPLFSNCDINFDFYGASELLYLYRAVRVSSLELPFEEQLSHDENNHVVITKLSDYYNFISDENENLRRYLFESNVRDFLGYNTVNSDIADTLNDEKSPNFWWLNNGVTIIGSNAHIHGKKIYIEDVQIVNGLQTTETIFRHFKNGAITSKDKNILVKIITTTCDETRKLIIKATNNQSNIAQHSLHATDKIQRDIEDILRQYNFYYVRREHYYKNEGKPSSRFIEPLYIASGILALVLKRPAHASGLKNKFMKNVENYGIIFSDKWPIEVWPTVASIYKQTDAMLIKLLDSHRLELRSFAKWRGMLALAAVAMHFKTFSFSISDLITLKDKDIPEQYFRDAWEIIKSVYRDNIRMRKINDGLAKLIASHIAKYHNVLGHKVVCKNTLRDFNAPPPQVKINLTDEFVEQVFMLLPKQPWEIGIHREIAEKLECDSQKVSAAIKVLIARNRCFAQKDGVVYDKSGQAIAVDKTRCPKSIDEINGHKTQK